MIYKNVEFHNVAELINNEDGSISWRRIPTHVHDKLETEQGKRVACDSTGVEMRFVIKEEKVIIQMSSVEGNGVFHIYRGSIQGGWEDHEVHKVVGREVEYFVIEKSKNTEHLKVITQRCGYPWDCEVVRVIFDRGYFKIHDIVGTLEPPLYYQRPNRMLMTYGSSITHGSNSIDMSHSWVSILAHNLHADVRNLGMSGSCAMEPDVIEYIAADGEKGNWDIAILELGINVLHWDEEKIISRVTNAISQIAGRNMKKPVIVISPFYYCGDDFDDSGSADKWRRLIKQTVTNLSYKNVTYINGLDILGDMNYMSADEVHPNIYGVQKIAESMTEYIKMHNLL